MYKVLLVDDEPWALSGIHDTFQWDKFGFEVLAQTTVAAEALEIILKEQPDVVFTDIRMPEMSGIQLMQKVREAGLDTEFVVISGFGEFSYAQQALRQGAFDYCLKPLEFDYADKLLAKLFTYLENKDSSRKFVMFETLFDNKGGQKDMLRRLGLDSGLSYYQCLVVIPDRTSPLDHVRLQFPENISKIEVRLGPDKLFYLFNLDADIKKLVDFSGTTGCSIGISRLSASAEDVEDLYYEADIAAANAIIYDESRVFRYKKRNPEAVNHFIDRIVSLADNNQESDLMKLMDEIPIFFRVNALGVEDIVYLWNHLVAFATKRFDGEQLGEFDFIDYTQLIQQFSDIQAIAGYLKNDVFGASGSLNAASAGSETNNSDFTSIIAYINEHCGEQLYLRDIAKMFYMNPNYCCRLFKKYTKSTFSEYLNKLRLEMAVKLLKTTELTIEAIAQRAGYNDYFYFIKLFKKNQGIPPARFRKEFLSSGAGSVGP